MGSSIKVLDLSGVTRTAGEGNEALELEPVSPSCASWAFPMTEGPIDLLRLLSRFTDNTDESETGTSVYLFVDTVATVRSGMSSSDALDVVSSSSVSVSCAVKLRIAGTAAERQASEAEVCAEEIVEPSEPALMELGMADDCSADEEDTDMWKGKTKDQANRIAVTRYG